VDGPWRRSAAVLMIGAFSRSGYVLNTGGLSASGLFHIATVAHAGLSELMVKEAEELALAGVMATDVKERRMLSSSSSRTLTAMAFVCLQFSLLFFGFFFAFI
jgi:hypothetical protein